MKYTRLLFLPAVALLTLSAGGNPTFTYCYLKQGETIGPFNNEDIYLNYDIDTTFNLDSVEGRYQIYIDKTDALTGTGRLNIADSKIVNSRIPLKDRFGELGLRLRVYLNVKNFPIFDSTVKMYLPNPKDVTFTNQTYQYDDCCLWADRTSFYSYEKYDFSTFNEYITTDNTGALSLKESVASYEPKNSYRYKAAYLIITDYENIYPFVIKNRTTKEIKVPLEIEHSANQLSFKISSKMYVNPYNNIMSSTHVNGYRLTEDFFIPLGKEKEFEKNEVKIVIEEGGFNKNNITIPLRYFYSDSLFGECNNSDYCVQGGIKEWFYYF